MASPLSISISLFFAFLCSLSSFTAGTRKELRTKSVINEPAIIRLVTSTQSTRLDPSRVIQLSWQPRIFLYRGFLSDEECDHLISLAKGKLEISSVSDHGTKKTNNINPLTTLDIDQDEVVAKIENRISAWTFLPEENGKHMQIMHYLPEKRTNQPHNYYGDEVEMDSGLMATVVLFLSNVTRGGEVLFPGSELKNTQVKDETWSDCSKEGYAINPVKGNALLFFNMQLSASPDNTSSHSTCPVLDGEKWCATKFFHVRAINENNFSSESNINGCTDEDDSCARWAALGECEKNPVYMIGSPDYYGSCRKSCNAC